MKTYRITNRTSGADLGLYTVHDDEDPCDAMARDAGYADHAACVAEVGEADLDVVEMPGCVATIRDDHDRMQALAIDETPGGYAVCVAGQPIDDARFAIRGEAVEAIAAYYRDPVWSLAWVTDPRDLHEQDCVDTRR